MKIRSDFVTNSSSSSFIAIEVRSKEFVDVIKHIVDSVGDCPEAVNSVIEGDTFQVFEDENYLEVPSNLEQAIATVICYILNEDLDDCLYDEEYYFDHDDENIPYLKILKKYFTEWKDEYDEEKYNAVMELLNKENLIDTIEYIKISQTDYGYGGDSDERYDEENYTDKELERVRAEIAKENNVSIDEIDNDMFFDYVGPKSSRNEITYTYDKSTGISEVTKEFEIE